MSYGILKLIYDVRVSIPCRLMGHETSRTIMSVVCKYNCVKLMTSDATYLSNPINYDFT